MHRPLAAAITLLLLAGCGQQTTNSAEEFQGEERAVAQVVEDLQEAGETKDTGKICRQLLARELADRLNQAGTTCTREMERSIEDADDFELVVEDVTVTGATARATVRRGEGREDARTVFEFSRSGGAWRATRLSAGS